MSGTYIIWPPPPSGGSGGSGVTTVGSMDAQVPSVWGASIVGTTLYMQSATGSVSGLINISTQAFGGVKIFSSSPILPTLPLGNIVTVGSSNQLSAIAFTANATGGTIVQRDLNGSAVATNWVSATTTVQSSGTANILLNAGSTRVQKIVGSNTITGGFVLPIATNMYAGQKFELNNNTTQPISIFTASSVSLGTAVAGAYADLICVDNSTAGGVWDVHWLAPTSAVWGFSGLGVTGSLTVTSLQSASPLFSNANGALVQGSVSLANQVVGVLPQANVASVSLVLGVNTFGSLSASQVTTSPLSPNAQVMTNAANQLVVGSVNLTTQVTGSVSVTRVNATGLAATAQVSTNATGQLVTSSVDLAVQVTGILPQGNLTLTPTFTQTTIGSVSQTSSAGGAAYTVRWPGAQGSNGQVPTNDGSGNLSWTTPGGATGTNVATATAQYAIGSTDGLVLCSSASFNVLVPTAVGTAGRQITIMHNGVSLSQNFALNTVGSQSIGGVVGAGYVLYTNTEAVTIESDNANWQVISHRARTPMTSYAPTIFATGGGLILGSNTSKSFWWRDGQFFYWNFQLNQTQAGGASGTGTYILPLPSGIVADSTKVSTVGSVSTTNGGGYSVGFGSIFGSAGPKNDTGPIVLWDTLNLAIYNAVNSAYWGAGFAAAAANTTINVNFQAKFEVAGWQP